MYDDGTPMDKVLMKSEIQGLIILNNKMSKCLWNQRFHDRLHFWVYEIDLVESVGNQPRGGPKLNHWWHDQITLLAAYAKSYQG